MTDSRGRNIRDVKETIFVLVLFVNTAHERSCRRQDLIDEDEDGLFRRKLDTLADDVDELADREVCRNKILLLINGSDVRFLDLFTDNLLKRSQSVIEISGEASRQSRITGKPRATQKRSLKTKA